MHTYMHTYMHAYAHAQARQYLGKQFCEAMDLVNAFCFSRGCSALCPDPSATAMFGMADL